MAAQNIQEDVCLGVLKLVVGNDSIPAPFAEDFEAYP